MKLSVARMVRDQKLTYYRRRCEDLEAALHEIVRIYGDNELSNAAAQDRTFDVATEALVMAPRSRGE